MVSVLAWQLKMVVLCLVAVVLKAVQDSLFSFSKQYRLVSRRDFQSVFVNPLKVNKKFLLALYKPNTCGHLRLGMIISKTNVRKAVDRNALRRLIREAVRRHSVLQFPHDVVILVRKGCHIAQTLRENKHKIQEDLNQLLNALVNK